MEHKILKQEKNPLLHREEYSIEIQSDTNPSFEDVKKIIGKDAEVVVIKSINGNFGRDIFLVEALVYNSKKDRETVEKIPRKIKKKLEEQAKKAEEEKAKAEEKPIEEPAEEKGEEKSE